VKKHLHSWTILLPSTINQVKERQKTMRIKTVCTLAQKQLDGCCQHVKTPVYVNDCAPKFQLLLLFGCVPTEGEKQKQLFMDVPV
jgi:hypothetical protein